MFTRAFLIFGWKTVLYAYGFAQFELKFDIRIDFILFPRAIPSEQGGVDYAVSGIVHFEASILVLYNFVLFLFDQDNECVRLGRIDNPKLSNYEYIIPLRSYSTDD